ncbi:MAG: type I CRISPR-associated protein Cas7 [Candidatus Omnitrophica bacterium]|nr:type I CRISPR-associated protein Cas7 [Candidatus Omnitrophota bacterium]
MSNEKSNEERLVERRATGLLVIEVRNSNPNGDPDRESDPRQRQDGRGEISSVSFKRKLRDLVEKKDGPVWKALAGQFNPNLKPEKFMISESRETKLADMRSLNEKEFTAKYWDGRIFGNTELEKGRDIPVKTGVVQFGLAISVSPVLVERMTTTNPAVEADKSRGMAPLAFRIVQHGVYCMPFFVNPTAATKTNCTINDLELLLKLIPLAYPHTASYVRTWVGIRYAWYMEHTSALGSCSDFALIDALTPKRKNKEDSEKPSTLWDDYDVPTEKDLPRELKDKLYEKKVRDLMNE